MRPAPQSGWPSGEEAADEDEDIPEAEIAEEEEV